MVRKDILLQRCSFFLGLGSRQLSANLSSLLSPFTSKLMKSIAQNILRGTSNKRILIFIT